MSVINFPTTRSAFGPNARCGSRKGLGLRLSDMNKNLVKKGSIVGVILLIFIVFYLFDLGQYLSLEYLKASHARFAGLYADYPAQVILAYMGIYIVATAFSLPGAVILTLAGGGLFGLGVGLVVVSFASSIGATLACLVSRFVMRDVRSSPVLLTSWLPLTRGWIGRGLFISSA